jgi:hypothetical protein
VNLTEPRNLLDLVEGATILSSDVSDEEGMHFYLSDGRVLVIVGTFAVSLLRVDTERLH